MTTNIFFGSIEIWKYHTDRLELLTPLPNPPETDHYGMHWNFESRTLTEYAIVARWLCAPVFYALLDVRLRGSIRCVWLRHGGQYLS